MSETARILLVEDEQNILDAIKLNLDLEGYEVVTATDGAGAISQFKAGRFDLIILDVMLPEMDGFRVCQTIRLEDEETPILFLTARDSNKDKVTGLKLGGDDYLTKPFNLEELLLRVHNLIKRKKVPVAMPSEYRFGNNAVNFKTFEISTANGSHTLSKKEILLLKLLVERKNEVVSRDQILEHVWGYDVYPSTRTIDNFIVNFRKYFEDNPKSPRYFQSVRGVGYKFND